jgi:hypothetical protein
MPQAEPLRRELDAALRRKAATSRILGMIARGTADTRTGFDSIAAAVLELFEASSANVFTYDGKLLHAAALAIPDAAGRKAIEEIFPQPPGRGLIACRAVLEGRSPSPTSSTIPTSRTEGTRDVTAGGPGGEERRDPRIERAAMTACYSTGNRTIALLVRWPSIVNDRLPVSKVLNDRTPVPTRVSVTRAGSKVAPKKGPVVR